MANLSDKQILKNAFPKWAEGEGLFAAMTDMPWSASVDGLILDIEYFGNRSGLKFCSPIIYNFLGDDGAVTENGRNTIARVLSTRYKKQWQRLWDTYDSKYEPLDNYDMSVEETRETTGTDNFTDTRNDSRTVTEDITDTRNLQQLHTGTDTNVAKNVSVGESSSVNSRNGFNSSDPNGVPVQNQTNKNQSTVDSTDTETKNLSDTDTGTVKRDGTTEDKLNGNLTRDRDTSESETISRRRHGLNGMRSRQEIIEAEREVWMWDYFGQVFRDVDKVLTLAIFDPCKVQSTGLYAGGSGGEQYVLPVATNNQLGGIRAPVRIPGATTPVYVDSAGYLYTVPQEYPPPYVLPIASNDVLGGVKPVSKTDEMLGEIGVDVNGKLWFKNYQLPQMSSSVLGGAKAVAKTDSMTNEVGIDENGLLWADGAGESSEIPTIQFSDLVNLTGSEFIEYVDSNPFFKINRIVSDSVTIKEIPLSSYISYNPDSSLPIKLVVIDDADFILLEWVGLDDTPTRRIVPIFDRDYIFESDLKKLSYSEAVELANKAFYTPIGVTKNNPYNTSQLIVLNNGGGPTTFTSYATILAYAHYSTSYVKFNILIWRYGATSPNISTITLNFDTGE